MATSSMAVVEHLRSSKNLWMLISGSSLRSKDLVGTELQTNFTKISKGLRFYKHSNNLSANELKTKKLDENLTNFLLQLSKFMNLDEIQCYDLFCDFLLNDYRGSSESLQISTLNERLLQNLMLQLWDYYRCERLYLLLCIKEVFGHRNDRIHPYRDLFEDYVTLLDEDAGLGKSLIDQWTLLQKTTFLGSKTQASLIMDSQGQSWMLFNLREQCELLQVFLIYYKTKTTNGTEFLSLLTTFKEHSFGRKQPQKHNLEQNAEDIIDAIGYLECLIVLQNLKLCNLATEERPNDYFLATDKKSFEEIDSVVSRFGYQKEHGPVMLAWVIVRSFVLGTHDMAVTRALGKSALDLGSLSYIERLLDSPVFQGNGVVANCTHTVLYDLMSSLLFEFKGDSLGSTLSLSRISGRLVRNQRLALEFWEHGLEEGVGSLLSTLMVQFPYSFEPLVDFMSDLAVASVSGARTVLKAMKVLPCCTLPRDLRVAVQEVYDIEEGNTLYLLEDYHPFGIDEICLVAGTIGRPLPLTESKDTVLIQWKYALNGWALSFVIVDQLLQEFSTGTGQLSVELVNRVTCVIRLTKTLLSSDPNLIDQLSQLLDKVFAVSHRLLDLGQPPLDILSMILDIATALSSRVESKQIWREVVQTGILPTSVANLSAKASWREYSFGHGSIKKLITAQECVSGTYELTLSFLSFVSAYYETMANEDDSHYVASVRFVVDEVMPSYSKWWFRNVEQREQVGQKCLDVMHHILGAPSSSEVSKSVYSGHEKLRKLVIRSLLHHEAGQSLLHLICTGEEAIHRALEQQSSWVSGRGLELIRLVKLALSVLNRLLFFCAHGSEKTSPLMICICSQPITIRIVANYVYHRFDIRLATLAMMLMRRFARNLPISLLVCLGQEGSAFTKHLILRLETRTEDVHLKVAILKFFAFCVESQPGMTEAFVGSYDETSSEATKTKFEFPCLDLVMQILRQYKENLAASSRELRCASLSFLHALWVGRQAIALDSFRKNADLWDVLLDPLFKEGLASNFKVAAYTLGILAQEFLCRPSSNVQKPSKGLVEVLDKAIQKGIISDWSSTVHKALLPQGENDRNTSKEVMALLESWRDFVMIGTKCGFLKIPVAQKNSILDGCLTSLSQNMNGPQDKSSLLVLSETLRHFLYLWQEDCRSHVAHWFERLPLLLQPIVTSGDGIPSKVVSDVFTICMVVIGSISPIPSKPTQRNLDHTLHVTCLCPHGQQLCIWIGLSSEILNSCIMEVEKTNGDNTQFKLHLIVLCASMIQKLISTLATCEVWFSELQRHSVVHTLLNFVTNCLSHAVGLEASLAVLELLAELSQFAKVCKLLAATDVIQSLCLPLLRLPSYGTSDSEGIIAAGQRHLRWTDVYEATFRLVTNVLHNERHFVVSSALDFAVINSEKFRMLPLFLHKGFNETNLKSSMIILRLIHELSLFPSAWNLHCNSTSRELLDFTFNTCYVATAYLLRPQVILHSLGEVTKDSSMRLPEDEDNVRLRRISSTEETERPNPKLQKMRTMLIEVLSICLSVMSNFSPALSEILCDQGFDVNEWEPLLEVGFGTPSLEQITPISFGTILSCTAMCTRLLNVSERLPSPPRTSSSHESTSYNWEMLTFLLERSLYLIVSQAGLILLSTPQPSWDKQLFKRELAAELSSCIQSRYVRRGGSSVSPVGSSVASSPSSSVQSTVAARSKFPSDKWPFLNLVTTLSDSMFK